MTNKTITNLNKFTLVICLLLIGLTLGLDLARRSIPLEDYFSVAVCVFLAGAAWSRVVLKSGRRTGAPAAKPAAPPAPSSRAKDFDSYVSSSGKPQTP